MACLIRCISPLTALAKDSALRESDRSGPLEDPADLPFTAAGEFFFLFFLFLPKLSLSPYWLLVLQVAAN